MKHDFEHDFEKGCYDENGIMDYIGNKTTWSSCSSESLEFWFNIMGVRCKAGPSTKGDFLNKMNRI